MTPPRVSVVIRCLNEERHIGRLLTGIARQTVQPLEVVVVDSGSTDATLSIAQRFARVRVIHISKERFSFGRSLNLGCDAAEGDVVVIASAHVYPLYDTWIELLTAPFAEPAAALTYGRQVGDERTRFSERQVLDRWFPEDSQSVQDHPFCNNANAAIRRSIWVELPYDEELTGLEDLDWAKRAAGLGHRLAYVAQAPVAHVHEETWPQVVNRYRREAIAHKRIYPEQRLTAPEAISLAVASMAFDLRQAAREGSAHRHLTGIAAFRSAQYLGTFRGFRQQGPVPAALKRRFYYPSAPSSVAAAPPAGSPIDYSTPERSQ